MTPFTFALPPKQPGVYVLKHGPTGSIYIGSSTNLRYRFNEWRQVIQLGGQARGARLAKLMRGTSVDDWVFWVVTISGTVVEARETEKQLILAAKSQAEDVVLNSIVGPAERVSGVSCEPATTISDVDGVIYSYAEAAEKLGCRKLTLIKRLAKYRTKGVTSITIENLINPKLGRPRKY